MAGVRLGVTRAYLTRHGPGPFVTEDPTLELPEPHDRAGQWQGPVRVGHLDAVALRYAVEACGGIDAVALTHLDTAREQAGCGSAAPTASGSGGWPTGWCLARIATSPTRSG